VKYLKIIDDGHKIVIRKNLKVLKVVGLTSWLAFAMFEALDDDLFFQSFLNCIYRCNLQLEYYNNN
jgi:hypothetical protein